jgi:MOSC domain-containing protein
MATVVGLYIYPVKSARGIPKPRVRVAAGGLEWDRHWMVVDANGTFITQRTHPQLARLVPEIGDDSLTLTAPDLPALHLPLLPCGEGIPVRVWDHSCIALDQGSAAAEWASQAVGQSVRLVRVSPAMDRAANPKYAGSTFAPVAFPDGFPILVCNEASLADLNERLPEPVPMERFRPNLVVSGLPAFAEDRIDSLQIGGITLRLVKPCTRCTIPSVDQRTGEQSTDPFPALRSFRFDRTLRGATFGENAVIATGAGGWLEQGTECQVTFEESAVFQT